MRQLEGAEAARATATGMAAVTSALLCFLKAGDHIVAARAMFGSCLYVAQDLCPRFGIECTLVDGRDTAAWQRAMRPNTRALFFETPANPTLDLVDIAAVSEIAHAAGALVIVDNVFATPLMQKPLTLGADIVVYSATKHIDGQGRCLGGVILCSQQFLKDHLHTFLRQTGPALSPFNAWVLLKGLETLPLRVRAQSRDSGQDRRSSRRAAGLDAWVAEAAEHGGDAARGVAVAVGGRVILGGHHHARPPRRPPRRLARRPRAARAGRRAPHAPRSGRRSRSARRCAGSRARARGRCAPRRPSARGARRAPRPGRRGAPRGCWRRRRTGRPGLPGAPRARRSRGRRGCTTACRPRGSCGPAGRPAPRGSSPRAAFLIRRRRADFSSRRPAASSERPRASSRTETGLPRLDTLSSTRLSRLL